MQDHTIRESGIKHKGSNTTRLDNYLREIDRQAETMFSQLVKQMTIQEGITEELKASDQMAWVGAMNSVWQRAKEIVNAELISIL